MEVVAATFWKVIWAKMSLHEPGWIFVWLIKELKVHKQQDSQMCHTFVHVIPQASQSVLTLFNENASTLVEVTLLVS